MIQRIQTLFLIAAAGLIAALLFMPMSHIMPVDNIGEEIIIRYTEKYEMMTFLIVTLVLSLVAIFLYKNRPFQMRVCILNMLILVAFQIWLMVLFFRYKSDMIFSISIVFPIVAAILTYLAFRYIARDEAMVAAASRLRGPRKK